MIPILSKLPGCDRFLTSIDHMVSKINEHLPKNRRTLKQLLTEEDPRVETIDGKKHFFKKRELEKTSNIIPKEIHEKIMLPLLIIRRVDKGKGIFTLSGNNIESRAVMAILNLPETSSFHGEVTLYRIQIQELFSKLGSSLIAIGFDIPRQKNQECIH